MFLPGIFTMKLFVLLLLPTCATAASLSITPSGGKLIHDLTEGSGSPITFTCTAPGGLSWDEAKLEWLDPSSRKVTTDHGRIFVTDLGQSLALKISTPENEDGGSYTCRGEIEGEATEASIKLELYTGVTVSSPSKQYPVRYSDAKIYCIASSSISPVLTWYKGSAQNWVRIRTGPHYIQQADHLVIKNITMEDNGTYNCNLDILELGKTKAFIIEVIVTVLPVIDTPITMQPLNPIEGDNLELFCSAQGIPQPKYRYLKNGVALNVEYTPNGRLELKSITRDDEGKYECQANNEGGTATAEVMLNVLVPPSIGPIQNVTMDEGNEFRFVCQATGDPKPNVFWRRKDVDTPFPPFSSGNEDKYVEEQVTTVGENNELTRTTLSLVFNSLVPSDAADYVCSARNGAGEKSVTAHIDVQYKPNFDDQPTKTFYGWVGGNTNLTCKANGNPEPVITWSFNSQDIESGPYYRIQMETARVKNQATGYLIPSVRAENKDTIFGIYTCHANNRFGSTDESLEFKEATVPGEPSIEVTNQGATLLGLTLRDPLNTGGQPVKSFYITYKKANTNDSPGENTVTKTSSTDWVVTQITTLEPNTEYEIQAFAVSDVGRGLPRTVLERTSQVRRPDKLLIVSSKTGTGDSYTLEWTLISDGGAEITNFEITYAKVQVNQDEFNISQVIQTFESIQLPGKTRSYEIRGLQKLTYYQAKIIAFNRIGQSDPAEIVFKTTLGVGPAQGAGGPVLGTGGILGIILVLLLVLVAAVDVAFCVTKQCGLVWTVRNAFCKKQDGGSISTKSPEDGDEAATKLLDKEKEDLRTENEVSKEAEVADEAETESSEKKELEPEDKEEKLAEPAISDASPKGEKPPTEPAAVKSDVSPAGTPNVETHPASEDKTDATANV